MTMYLSLDEARHKDPETVQAFSFGVGQVFSGCVMIVESYDKSACRYEMIDNFNQKWAFQYDVNQDLADMIERWDLQVITKTPEYMIKRLKELESQQGT